MEHSVTIVMPIYRPNKDFFIKQLRSLDEQDYTSLSLLIWDDDPLSEGFDTFVQKHLKKLPFRYVKGNENLGYIKAFEKLTQMADSEYIAYCDQDDIWLPEKISGEMAALCETDGVFATCNRAIIDKDDKVIISDHRREQKSIANQWRTGDEITKYAAFSCLALGMTILMKTEIAKAACPFPSSYGHDAWLCLVASVFGTMVFVDDVLVQYRIHGKNTTGTLKGVKTKEDYYQTRVSDQYDTVQTFLKRFPEFTDTKEIEELSEGRYHHRLSTMWGHRNLAPQICYFECMLAVCPGFLAKLLIWCTKKIA